jgi:hypothetical protein
MASQKYRQGSRRGSSVITDEDEQLSSDVVVEEEKEPVLQIIDRWE